MWSMWILTLRRWIDWLNRQLTEENILPTSSTCETDKGYVTSHRCSVSCINLLYYTVSPAFQDTRKKLDPTLVEHTSLIRAAVPVLPIVLAYFCLVCNVLAPGLGERGGEGQGAGGRGGALRLSGIASAMRRHSESHVLYWIYNNTSCCNNKNMITT